MCVHSSYPCTLAKACSGAYCSSHNGSVCTFSESLSSCSVQTDAWFEVISVVMNMAIWHTKHAAVIAGSDSITLEQAKEVHRSLKLAAGMFLHIKDNLLSKLPASGEKGADFDPRVVEAYAHQSQAEAQEGDHGYLKICHSFSSFCLSFLGPV